MFSILVEKLLYSHRTFLILINTITKYRVFKCKIISLEIKEEFNSTNRQIDTSTSQF